MSVTDEGYRLPDDEIPKLPDGTRNQIKMATSLSHLLTHYPKNIHCDACNKAKLRASPSHPTPTESKKTYKEFGDHVTCDLKTMFKDKNSWGIDGQRCLLVTYDSATGYIASYPLQEKTADNIVECWKPENQTSLL